MFIPYKCEIIVDCLLRMCKNVTLFADIFSKFGLASMWIPSAFLPSDVNKILKVLSPSWSVQLLHLNSANFGDAVDVPRSLVQIFQSHDPCDKSNDALFHPVTIKDTGYDKYLRKEYDHEIDFYSLPLPTNVLDNTVQS